MTAEVRTLEPQVGRGSPAAVRSLSVVIPAYNEELRLPGTLRDVDAFLTQAGYDGEIIVVNDGSRDRTLEVLRGLGRDLPHLRILSHPVNRGKGHAVRAGMLAAVRDTVLFCDADQSTPIQEVQRLWPWLDRGFDVVIASRHLEGARRLVRQPLPRRLLGKVFNAFVGAVALRGFRDSQCGFKLFRAEAARRIFGSLRTEGFGFDVEALIRARALGYPVAEVPVRWVDAPGSKLCPARDGLQMLFEVLRIRGLH